MPAERHITVEVHGDHLERLAKCTPASAIGELIWNSLDADASRVAVRLIQNRLGGLDELLVEDNGEGIGAHGQEVDALFRRLGGSWKGEARVTRQNRMLHGKAGQGRFRAFALGDRVEWSTHRLKDGKIQSMTIGGRRRVPDFTISEEQETPDAPGTTVRIWQLEENLKLTAEALIERLTPEFALYLQQYQHVRVLIDGRPLDPAGLQVRRKELELLHLTMEDGTTIDAELVVIEWRNPRAQRGLWLCDENGFSLLQLPAGIQAPGFAFTAYLKSAYLRTLHEQNLLDSELPREREALLDSARKSLKDYFRERSAEQARGAVEKWRAEDIYPYGGVPSTAVERVERQVFDICALNLSDHLPDFEKSDVRQKRLAFRLLREAIERNPESLQSILTEVLGLPKEKQDELAELLQQTPLSTIINASKVVADRVNFLAGLSELLFEPQNRKRLLERRQLHRILAANTWLFGEEFNLTVDDESLNAALARHLELLGRSAAEAAAPVLREDGTEGVLDLMLSKVVPLPHHERREHLVVELKRPSQSVDGKVLQQIKEYAFAVARDERFRDTRTTWRFVAVSNSLGQSVEKEASQKNRPLGLVYEDDEQDLSIWVFTWSQVIEDARTRLEFFRRSLDYNATRETAQRHLEQVYAKYLPQEQRTSRSSSEPG